METTIFEDTCREMFGVHAYIVFTIDKLVQNIVRQVSWRRKTMKQAFGGGDATTW